MSIPDNRGFAVNGASRDEYVRFLISRNVPSRQLPYYVKRVNQFIASLSPQDPCAVDTATITETLTALGREPGLRDWQFQQLINAVRQYLVGLKQSGFARQVDWNYW